MDTYPTELVGAPAEPPAMPARAEWFAAKVAARAAAPDLDAPLLMAAADWRLAGSLVVLGEEANTANPNRDRASDGTIGNAAHAKTGRASDHNPWVIDPVTKQGVVRARDIDCDGLDLAAAFEKCRAYAHAGWLPQLTGGGYLILNRRITLPDWSGWAEYRGTNPHVLHGHVSVSTDPARFDDRRPWLIFTNNPWPHEFAPTPPPPAAPGPAPAPAPARVLERGPDHYPPGDPRHALTRALQTRLRSRYPLYAKRLVTDGYYGPATQAAVREFQRRSPGLVADGIAGPATLARLQL